ncbi:MAG: Maf family protein [Stenotrophobium sp.]
MPISPQAPLILASGSRYRAELLARLHLPFTAMAPDINESALPGEPAEALTRRLALAKARTLALRHPGRWVLGSDQAAASAGRILGKPGTRSSALEQLRWLSGREVQFFTAVALVRGDTMLQGIDLTTVRFRALVDDEIERYLDLEPALDCAGSFKCEGLGISLLESVDSSDPTGLIGLPLILVRRLLASTGNALP